MGIVVKISKNTKLKAAKIAFKKIDNAKAKGKKKLADFYGALPTSFEDGVTYQRKQRDDWE